MTDREQERAAVVAWEAPHPWHFIAEELLARGWPVEDLASHMVPTHQEFFEAAGVNLLTLDLYRFVGPNDPRCRIGEKCGKAIARAFDVGDDFILNLEAAWLANPERGDHLTDRPAP